MRAMIRPNGTIFSASTRIASAVIHSGTCRLIARLLDLAPE